MKVTMIPIVIGALRTVTNYLLLFLFLIIKGPGLLGSWRSSGDYPNDSIIENGQNTEESSRDLRRLAITQTPVKNHQLNPVKNSKEEER